MKKGDFLTIRDLYGRVFSAEILDCTDISYILKFCKGVSSIIFGIFKSDFHSNYELI